MVEDFGDGAVRDFGDGIRDDGSSNSVGDSGNMELGEGGDGFLQEAAKIKHLVTLMNLSFFRCGFPEHVREL